MSVLIVVFSLYWVGKAFGETSFENLRSHITRRDVGWMLSMILLLAVAKWIAAFAWKRILEGITGKRMASLTSQVWLRTNIAKYFPSNLLHYAGRHYFSSSLGVTQKVIGIANVLEILIALVLSSLIMLASLPFSYRQLSLIFSEFTLPWTVYLLLVPGGGLVIIGLATALKRFWIPLLDVQTWHIGKLLTAVYLQSMFFLIMGTVFCVTTLQLDGRSFNVSSVFYLIFVANISWFLGFIVPGVPGGIGVREAIMLVFLKQQYAIEVVLMSALLFRLITICSDYVSFFSTFLYKHAESQL